MRGMIASLLILLGLAAASAEEPPEGLAAALTARDYEKALEIARGASTEPKRLKDIETLAAAKKRIIDSAAAKKRLPVTVEVAGQSVRGTLVAADQSSYSVEALGVAQARSWKEMSSDVFYLTARRCFDDSSGADHLTLARACAALGLAERGESELQAATRADAGLASEAAALRKRLVAAAPAGAAEEGGPAPGPAPSPRRPSAEAAKGVPTGYESGLAARLLQEEDRRRIAAIPLQDLLDKAKGRYTQVSDDGVMGYWGLDAVRARQDAAGKPYPELLKGGAYQTERILFADLGTGVTTMKLTNEPYGTGDEILYFGKAGFSADGSLMVWQRSQKPSLWGPGGQSTTDTHGPVLLDSDGSRPRTFRKHRP